MAKLRALQHAIENTDIPYAKQLRKGFNNLKFSPTTEREFRYDWNEIIADRAATPLYFAMALFMIFGVYEFIKSPIELAAVSTPIRMTLIFPALCLGIFATRSAALRRRYVAITSCIVAVVAIGQLIIIATGYKYGIPKPYEGLVLIIMFIHFYSGMYFRTGMATSFSIVIAYALVAWWMSFDQTLMFKNIFYLIAFASIGALGGYTVEYSTRASFLNANLLNMLLERDPVTNLHNRQFFETRLQNFWHQADAEEVPIALAKVGIDGFAEYNQKYGQKAGDELLSKVAPVFASDILEPAPRLAARHGGSEFVLVWFDRSIEQINAVLNTIIAEAEKLGENEPLSLSVGLAYGQPALGQPVSDLILEAEKALHKARVSGESKLQLSLMRAHNSDYEIAAEAEVGA